MCFVAIHCVIYILHQNVKQFIFVNDANKKNLLRRHIFKTFPSSSPSKKATNCRAEGKNMILLLEYLYIRMTSTECSGYALREYWRVFSGIYLSAWDTLCELTFEHRRSETSTPQLCSAAWHIWYHQGTLSVWQWGSGHSTRSGYMSQYFKIKSRHFLHSESFCRFCVRNTVQYNTEQLQSLKPLMSFTKGCHKGN